LLAGELRDRIAMGDYARSGTLESEAELAQRYDVSRVTVRRALELLREEGLVRSRKGAGWYLVAGMSFGQQLALGTFQHASSAVTEAGVKLVRKIAGFEFRPAPADIALLLGIESRAQVLWALTVRWAGRRPLDVATEWVPLPFAGSVSRADAKSPGIWATLRRQGLEISLVRQSIAAAAASETVADLLNTTVGIPVLLVRRLALQADERPLALSEHRYLGHRFRLDVEFRGGPAASTTEPPGVTEVP
jgi:GntR family transcriptional regulator